MRTTTPGTLGTFGSLGVLATTALIGLGAAPTQALSDGAAASSAPTVTRERGIVVECTGRHAGHDVWLSVYENDRHVNVFQVVLKEGDGRTVERKAGFWDGRTIRATMRMHGKRLAVTGPAVKTGRRIPVREELDDAGHTVVSEGFHRRLRTDLVMRYGAKRVRLACDPTFYYNLKVTKTPIE